MKHLLITLICATTLVAGKPATELLVSSCRMPPLPAELLRVDNNRLYLWVDSELQVTKEFCVRTFAGGDLKREIPIDTVFENIVVTSALSGSNQFSLSDHAQLTYSVCLPESVVADSIIIGLPPQFRDWYCVADTTHANPLSVKRECRFFENLRNAEIELELGRIDALILPITEITEELRCRFTCVVTNDQVEWVLISDLSPENLKSTALNYCLKGLFTEKAGGPISIIIDSAHIRTIFPRNDTYAKELFSGMKKKNEISRLGFSSPLLFPNALGRISEQVGSCGGDLIIDHDFQELSCRPLLQPLCLGEHLNRSLNLSSLVAESETRLANWNGNSPDSCWQDYQFKCPNELSKRLSENCWLIPLGRTPVAILLRPNVRYLLPGATCFMPMFLCRMRTP